VIKELRILNSILFCSLEVNLPYKGYQILENCLKIHDDGSDESGEIDTDGDVLVAGVYFEQSHHDLNTLLGLNNNKDLEKEEWMVSNSSSIMIPDFQLSISHENETEMNETEEEEEEESDQFVISCYKSRTFDGLSIPWNTCSLWNIKVRFLFPFDLSLLLLL